MLTQLIILMPKGFHVCGLSMEGLDYKGSIIVTLPNILQEVGFITQTYVCTINDFATFEWQCWDYCIYTLNL